MQVKGDLDNSIKDCDVAIRLEPGFYGIYLVRGTDNNLKGEWVKALNDFSEAIRLNPKCAKAYYWRGIVLKKRGEVAKAEADFAQSKKLRVINESSQIDVALCQETISILRTGTGSDRNARIKENSKQFSPEKYARRFFMLSLEFFSTTEKRRRRPFFGFTRVN